MNYPDYILAPLLDQEINPAIRVDALKWTEKSGEELKNYDFILFFGIGYGNVESYGRSIQFMIEIDPLGILIRQGIVGFVLYFVPYMAFIVYACVQFFRRPAQRLGSLKYCTYLYSTLAAFGISVIAGHALVSPAVSTFMLVISFRLWVLTREQNKLPRIDKGA